MPRLDPIKHYVVKSTGLEHLAHSDLSKLRCATDILLDTMRSLDLDQNTRFINLLNYRERIIALQKRDNT